MEKEKWLKKQETAYHSKDGFVELLILRGFDVIAPLWDILEDVRSFSGGDNYVTLCGGYARYCASTNKEPRSAGDVDIYCIDMEVFETLRNILENTYHLIIRHDNDTAVTYEKTTVGKLKDCPTIQIIKPINEGRKVAMGDTMTILENFDFTVVRAAIISPTLALVDADFEHDEQYNIIRIKNIHCPISSNLRCMKYAKKGYFLTPSECMKLFIDWDDRDDSYRTKLKDFLLNKEGGYSEEDVDELEALMRID